MDELLLSKPYEAMTEEELMALKDLNYKQYQHIKAEIIRRLGNGQKIKGYEVRLERTK